jgi:4,5-dihydroxyphthalate decarboxylase
MAAQPACPAAWSDVHQIPTEKNIGSMMISGELDATLFYLVDPNLIVRSTADLHRHPDIKLLFRDPLAEGIRYHRKTGLYPINHGMVIRRELAQKHPWAVLNILKAFNRANAIANKERMQHVEYHIEAGLLGPDAHNALATTSNPWDGRQSAGARNHCAVLAGRGSRRAPCGSTRLFAATPWSSE